MIRMVTLAHTIAGIEIDSITKEGGRRLKPLNDYLKPLQRRSQRSDGSEEVADFLDRRIARQERERGKSDG